MPYSNANSILDYGLVHSYYKPQTLEASLTLAAKVLLGAYAVGKSINPLDIYVGDGNANTLSVIARNGYATTGAGIVEHASLLLGGTGDAVDKLFGGAGDDVLLGEGGNDTLDGKKGNDILSGGAGADTFYWSTGDGVDTIKDWASEDYVIINNQEITTAKQIGVGSSIYQLADGTQMEYDSVTHQLKVGDPLIIDNFDISTLQAAELEIPAGFEQWAIPDPAHEGWYLQSSAFMTVTSQLTQNVSNKSFFVKQGYTIGGNSWDQQWGAYSQNFLFHQGIWNNKFFLIGNDETSKLFDGNVGVRLSSSQFTWYGSYRGNVTDARGGGIKDDVIIASDALWDSRNEVTPDHTKGGNDLLVGNKGSDTVYGGGGNDFIFGYFEYRYADNGISIINDRLADSHRVLQSSNFGCDVTSLDPVGMWHPDYMQANAADIENQHESQWQRAFLSYQDLQLVNDKDTLFGGAGNDYLVGGSNDDVLDGGANDDTLIGRTGSDFMAGGDGDDVMRGDGSVGFKSSAIYGDTDIEVLAFGKDTFNGATDGASFKDILHGGDGDDTLYGEAGDDVLFGDTGNDTLYGDDSQDVLAESKVKSAYAKMASNNDVLVGGAGVDSLYGGLGQDTLWGGEGSDYLEGNDGDDTLYGDAGADKVYGGAGKDILDGGAGRDTLDGGANDDIYIFGADSGHDTISESSGTIRLTDVYSIEQLQHGIRSDGQVLFHGNGSSITFAGSNFIIELANGERITKLDSIKKVAGSENTIGASASTIELTGTAGDDYVYKAAALTVLGAGDDTLAYHRGDGHVTVDFTDTVAERMDVLRLDATIAVGDVSYVQSGDDLLVIISNDDNSDIVTVKNFMLSADNAFTHIVFAQGSSSLTYANVLDLIDVVELADNAPVATADSASTDEDTDLLLSMDDLLANDSDTDGDTLTITHVGNAVGGFVSMDQDSGQIIFRPDADFNGTASFDYVVDDGMLARTATVTITVAAINDAPVIYDQEQQTDEDTAVVIAVADLLAYASDIDAGDVVAFDEGTLTSLHGTVIYDSGTDSVTFTPDADYNGVASFTYGISDGNGGTATANVNIDVLAVNDAPSALVEALVITAPETALTITADQVADDVDGDSVTFDALGTATHGSVAFDVDGNVVFTPDTGFIGVATFEYTVIDGNGGSSVLTANITVANELSITAAVSNINEDTNLVLNVADLLANVTDDNGLTLTITGVTNVLHGTAVFDDISGTVTFTPDADYNGNDAGFDYVVSDGLVETSGNVAVYVAPVNDAPTASDLAGLIAPKNASLLIPVSQLLMEDVDGDTLSIMLGTTSHGSVDWTDGSHTVIRFTPDTDYAGAASFAYSVSDGTASAGATVTMTVQVVTSVVGTVGNDVLEGFNTDDTLFGLGGNDTLSGGVGSDTLAGGADADTYLYASGHDVIIDTAGATPDVLQVKLASGVVLGDVSRTREDFDLVISFDGNTDDDVRIKNYFDGQSIDIQIIQSDDTLLGTWDRDDVNADFAPRTAGNDTVTGTSGADTLYGLQGNDILHGAGGNDLIYGDEGNDELWSGTSGDSTLYGGIGNDVLYGKATGSDYLDGGKGDDYLYGGGDGADTFVFDAGDGKDVIYTVGDFYGKYDPADAAQDTLIINGYSDTQALVTHDADDNLVLRFTGSDDQISIRGFSYADGFDLQTVHFTNGDGTGDDIDWNYADLKAMSLEGSSNSEQIYGYNDSDDVIHGGTGNDDLNGLDGNDTYLFSAGDGQDTISGTLVRSSAITAAQPIYESNGVNDVLRFDSTITADMVDFSRHNNDLVLNILGSTDRVTLANYFVRYGDATTTHKITDYRSISKIEFTNASDVVTATWMLSTDAINDRVTVEADHTIYILASALIGNDRDNTAEITAVSGSNAVLSTGAGGLQYITYTAPSTEGVDTFTYTANGTTATVAVNVGASNGAYAGTALQINTVDGDTLVGTTGNDTLAGHESGAGITGNDTLLGGNGNDVLGGFSGDDYLSGGKGADILYGDAGDDVLRGDSGNDTLAAGEGADTLYGGTGNDWISLTETTQAADVVVYAAGDGDDVIVGADASDTLAIKGRVAEQGHYSLDANGRISIDFGQSSSVVLSGGAPGTVSFNDNVYTLVTEAVVDNVSGTNNDDLIFNALATTLSGYDGDDVIQASNNHGASLSGGVGDDILISGNGDDTFDGGAGRDQYLFRDGFGNDTIVAAATNAGIGDVIVFDATTLSPDDMVITAITGGYTISFTGSTDELTVNVAGGAAQQDIPVINFVDGQGNLVYAQSIDDSYQATTDHIIWQLGGLAQLKEHVVNPLAITQWMLANDETTVTGDNPLNHTLSSVHSLSTGYDVFLTDAGGLSIIFGGVTPKIDTAYKFSYTVDGDAAGKGAIDIGYADLTYIAPDAGTMLGNPTTDIMFGTQQGLTFDGGAGNDIYIGLMSGYNVLLNAGTGQDLVFSLASNVDYDVDENGRYINGNVVEIAPAYSPSGVRFLRDGDDLLIYLGEDTSAPDMLRVQNQFAISWYGRMGVDYVHFSGSDAELDRTDLEDRVMIDSIALDYKQIYGTDNTETIDVSTSSVNHYINSRWGDDTVYGGSGNDTIIGHVGNYLFEGGAGNDHLSGGWGSDTLLGGDGDDALMGYMGNDTLSGGAGNDTYKFSAGADQDVIDNYVTGSTSDVDTIEFDTDIDPSDITLSVRIDQYGNPTDDLLITLVDSSTITVSGYFDPAVDRTIDQISFLSTNEVWDSADINAAIALNDYVIYGSSGNDTIDGGLVSRNFIYGGAGDDTLSSVAAQAYLLGQDDNDTLLYEGTGSSMLYGGSGDDTLSGGAGNDTLLGQADNDVLKWSAGEDIYDGGDGDDILLGTSGNDVIHFDQLVNIETIDGIDGADTLLGSSGNDVIEFATVNVAVIDGGDGNDEITATAGLATLIGGTGSDILNTGADDITAIYNVDDGSDVINNNDIANEHTQILQFTTGISRSSVGFEKQGDNLLVRSLTGPDYAILVTVQDHFLSADNAIDEIHFVDGSVVLTAAQIADEMADHYLAVGTSADETISGESHLDDTLIGMGGADLIDSDASVAAYLDGGAGNDTLQYSGAGVATLAGGTGNDTLTGSSGADTLLGQADNDVLMWGGATAIYDGGADTDTLLGTSGADTIAYSQLSNIEAISGNGGTDILLGTSSADVFDLTILDIATIDGSGGDDVLIWGGATTLYDGGADADTLLGTTGNDSIVLAQLANIETIDGGDGGDGGDGVDALLGTSGADSIDLTTLGIDLLSVEVIDGGDGDDQITGGANSVTLVGGLGNDVLTGGTGTDTYLYNVGDGSDVINNYDAELENIEVLKFETGISRNDVVFQRAGDNLLIRSLTDPDYAILATVQDHFVAGENAIDEVHFVDGSVVLTAADIDTAIADNYFAIGTNDGETIIGQGALSDMILGLDGGDLLESSASLVAYLDGGAGQDTLAFSGAGDATLIGGASMDFYNITLVNTTNYITVDVASGAIPYETDYINLLNINAHDVHYSIDVDGNGDPVNDDLYLQIDNENRILVQGAYTNETVSVPVLSFAEGFSISIDQIKQAVLPGGGLNLVYGDITTDDVDANDVYTLIGTTGNDWLLADDVSSYNIDADAGNDTVVGSTQDDLIYGGDGADFLASSTGDDTIYGGAGNDLLWAVGSHAYLDGGDDTDDIYYLGTGTATLLGGDGNDYLTGGNGSDYLRGGAGSDVIYGDAGADTYAILAADIASSTTEIDTIYDDNADTNVIDFTSASLDLHSLWFAQDGSNLVITMLDSAGQDQLVINNWSDSMTPVEVDITATHSSTAYTLDHALISDLVTDLASWSAASPTSTQSQIMTAHESAIDALWGV